MPLSLTSLHGATKRAGCNPHRHLLTGCRRALERLLLVHAVPEAPRSRVHVRKVKANVPVVSACYSTLQKACTAEALGVSHVRCLLQGTVGCVSFCRRLNWMLASGKCNYTSQIDRQGRWRAASPPTEKTGGRTGCSAQPARGNSRAAGTESQRRDVIQSAPG